MRVFILVALVLACVAVFIAAGGALTVLGMSAIGWVAAALVAFFLDCLFNGPMIPLVKKSPPS